MNNWQKNSAEISHWLSHEISGLAAVSYDNQFVPDFLSEYWTPYFQDLINQLSIRLKGKTHKVKDGINLIDNDKDVYLVTHPFWSDKYLNEIKKIIGYSVSEINVFDAVRKIKR